MGNRPDPANMFGEVDLDGSGGLDQAEFQTLADKISVVTEKELDAEELFAAFDADADGVLNEEETGAVMEANRPEGPPPPPPPGGMMGGMGGMQGGPPDLSRLFTDADSDGSGTLNATEAQSVADIISEATGSAVDVEELISAYDEDGDGTLSEEETLAALEANRPEAPPPPPPGEMTTTGAEIRSASTVGIESYLKMASLASGQSWAATISGQTDPALLSGFSLSVNTRA